MPVARKIAEFSERGLAEPSLDAIPDNPHSRALKALAEFAIQRRS